MKDRLKKLRENQKLTQKEFGSKIGVSDKVVSKWERGVSEPDIDMLKKISEIFFVAIEDLIGSQRQENAAFPARKIRKSILYYSAFGAATLCFFAATAIFCILYVFALNKEVELYRPVGQLAVGFVPIAFGIILFCVFTICSQIKFRAFPMPTGKHSKGKTYNEILRLPMSIDRIYSIYGNWISLYYLILQVWNSCNIFAYLFKVNVVLRYMSHGVCMLCLALVTTVACFALKSVEGKDKASAEIFKEIKAEKTLGNGD